MATGTRPTSPRRPMGPETPDTPPLENGDHLTRPEFERRYDAMPNVKKAELIEGVVYMPSPVSVRHGESHFDAITWLGLFRASTPGVRGGDNSSIRLDVDNMPQPDACLLIDPAHGGRARISGDNFIEGAPELIVEIATSSANYDLHEKLDVYRRNEVVEYVVWRTRDAEIDWFVLREGRYEPLARSPEGYYRSEVFPGLWLDPGAMIRGDLAAVLRVAQQGLQTPEHAGFVDRLRRQAAERAGQEGGRRP